MKGFALVLLCALVAVQARNAAVQQSTRASLGENPWVVHLRIATSNGNGLLTTCLGSLINESWILTTASCLEFSTFIWSRYGAVNVINPSLVTEGNVKTLHSEYDPETGANNIALININRVVHGIDNVSPVSLASAGSEVPASGKFCSFGANSDGAPGEILNCADIEVEVQEDGSIVGDAQGTSFDLGGPLVSDGVQVGLLTAAGETFTPIADYLPWIEEVTGLSFGEEAGEEAVAENAPQAVRVVYQAPEAADAVKFVN